MALLVRFCLALFYEVGVSTFAYRNAQHYESIRYFKIFFIFRLESSIYSRDTR